MQYTLICLLSLFAGIASDQTGGAPAGREFLQWKSLPDLPDELGVAGPFVGVHSGALIVAGGANFPVAEGQDLWQVPKVWHDGVWVLVLDPTGDGRWIGGTKLDRPRAYGACVNTPRGIACLGGSDGKQALADCFLLTWDPQRRQTGQTRLPPLPQPCAHGAAAVIGEVIYVAGGQSGTELPSAMTNFWRLDLAKLDDSTAELHWQSLPSWPGPSRAFNLTVAQHNGFDDCVYVLSGRRQAEGTEGAEGIVCLADVYEFNPQHLTPARTMHRPGSTPAGDVLPSRGGSEPTFHAA